MSFISYDFVVPSRYGSPIQLEALSMGHSVQGMNRNALCISPSGLVVEFRWKPTE